MSAEEKDIQIFLGGIDEVERATGQPHEPIPLEGNYQFLTITYDFGDINMFNIMFKNPKRV